MLEIKDLTVAIKDRRILDNVSLSLKEHDIFMVMGPNGAGKTTLFRAVMGMLPYSGSVMLYKKKISTYKPRELAKCLGVLSQKNQAPFPHSVYEIVSLGRYAYQNSIFSGLTVEDKDKIEEALRLTGVYGMKEQSVVTLSEGELQRVFLAQLFAQDPQILILDEPTNHLDLQYQIEIFDIIKEWVKQEGRAVLAAVHDLNIIYSYGTKALLLNEGRVHAQGSTGEVLSREHLKSVYKVDVAKWMQNLLKYWEGEK